MLRAGVQVQYGIAVVLLVFFRVAGSRNNPMVPSNTEPNYACVQIEFHIQNLISRVW
jgi:hypothetical protein